MCKSKHSIETIFCEILEEKFGIMICEQTFNIRFTEQDSNNYGLLTPKNWIDVIESHL